jgi:hypothetical protein
LEHRNKTKNQAVLHDIPGRRVGPEPVRLREIGAPAADTARDLRSLKPELNPMMPHMSDDGQGRLLAKCFASKRCRGCMLAFGEIR